MEVLNPRDFFQAEYGIPSMVLIPELDYSGDPQCALKLSWSGEIPAGFLHGKETSPAVREFEDWILSHFEKSRQMYKRESNVIDEKPRAGAAAPALYTIL